MSVWVRICLRVFWCALWLTGAACTVGIWWQASGNTIGTADGAALLIEIARICGHLGTYLVLWQLVLMSRLPLLERAMSFGSTARLHRWNGSVGIILVTTHVTLMLVGYAGLNNVSLIAQFLEFQLEWTDVLVATFGYAFLLAMIGLTITIVRRRLRYETWYAVHISAYLAIALFFSHQFSVGASLVGRPGARIFWYTLYGLAFGGIAVYRVGVPLYRYWRHQFKVKRVVTEAPGVVSIYVGGRDMKRFKYIAGQYAIWRFLAPDLWLQAHPFSFSVAPGGHEFRLTVKAVGDFTRALQGIKPGAPVVIDGPHGDFVLPASSRRPLLFIAGGIGITPIRSMIEAIPHGAATPILIYAARTQADLALRDELETILAAQGGRVHYVLSQGSGPGCFQGVVDQSLLAKLVPDITSRDIFLCGPPPMMLAVRKVLARTGVPRRHIRSERFAFIETKQQLSPGSGTLKTG